MVVTLPRSHARSRSQRNLDHGPAFRIFTFRQKTLNCWTGRPSGSQARLHPQSSRKLVDEGKEHLYKGHKLFCFVLSHDLNFMVGLITTIFDLGYPIITAWRRIVLISKIPYVKSECIVLFCTFLHRDVHQHLSAGKHCGRVCLSARSVPDLCIQLVDIFRQMIHHLPETHARHLYWWIGIIEKSRALTQRANINRGEGAGLLLITVLPSDVLADIFATSRITASERAGLQWAMTRPYTCSCIKCHANNFLKYFKSLGSRHIVR
jgi:hypothetical protein